MAVIGLETNLFKDLGRDSEGQHSMSNVTGTLLQLAVGTTIETVLLSQRQKKTWKRWSCDATTEDHVSDLGIASKNVTKDIFSIILVYPEVIPHASYLLLQLHISRLPLCKK